MAKKWYVANLVADEVGSFVIDLDDKERQVIKRFLDAQNHMVAGGGWCGYVMMHDEGHETKEQAVEAAIGQ